MTVILDDLDEINQPARLRDQPTLMYWLLILCVFTWGATGLARYDIETILGTGPVGMVISLVLWIKGRKARLLQQTGALSFFFVVFCFLLIVINGWSPTQAEEPIPWIIGAYAGGLSLVIGVAWSNNWRLH